MIAAFDTGIGTGSIAMGWMVERLGFRLAFVVAAVMVAAAIPYFLLVEKRFGYRADALTSTPSTP
jgi:predicted MFS family arabinose efflux permease